MEEIKTNDATATINSPPDNVSQEKYEVSIAGDSKKGKTCPFCKTEILENDEIIICPACNTPHHKGCWEENKGCTTFGCSEQHYEMQGTNPTDVCSTCGATLGGGQAFCPKCGTPKAEIQSNICSKCGTELQEGQEFCPKCGQKRDVILESETNTAIAEFNKQLENNGQKKKKRKKLKILLLLLIPLILVGVGVFGYFQFYLISGTYKFVSTDSKSTYTFNDGKYTYVSDSTDDDESEKGKYELKLGEVTLIDEDGDKTTYNRAGKYLYNIKNKFTKVFDKECNSDQTFSISSSYEDISLTTDLTLKSNGKYSYVINMTYSYTDYEYEYYGWYLGYQKVPKTKTVSDDLRDDSGTYDVSGNKIILHPSGKKDQILIVKDDYIYYTVLEKTN